MGVFTDLALLGAGNQFHLYITAESPEKMVVTVSLTHGDITDKQNGKIPSLNFNGTPAQLDADLVRELARYVPKAVGLITNYKEYNQEIEAAQGKLQEKRNKNQQAITTAAAAGQSTVAPTSPAAKKAPAKDPQTMKFEAAMKAIDDLENVGSYGQAIAKLTKIGDFPQFKDQIKAKLKRLKNKHVGYNMFELDTRGGAEAPATSPGEPASHDTTETALGPEVEAEIA